MKCNIPGARKPKNRDGSHQSAAQRRKIDETVKAAIIAHMISGVPIRSCMRMIAGKNKRTRGDEI